MQNKPEFDQINAVLERNRQVLANNKFDFVSAKPVRNYRKSLITGDRSLAAASIENLVKVLKPDQLKSCGLAYINNGIVRTVIDRTIFFVNPERSGYLIEPNDELVEGSTDQEVKEIEDSIVNDTITMEGVGKVNVKKLRQKLVRCNKRCKVHDRTDKLLASGLVFGLGALKIERFSKNESPDWSTSDEAFGEPQALRHLSSLRIKDVNADKRTGEFKGFEYDEGNGSATDIKNYKATDLVPAFNDDFNILDNSNYSGLSAVWSILEAANVIEAIIAEDLPEVTRQSHSKFGIMYAGTSKKTTLNKLKKELEAGTWLIHNEKDLVAEIKDLSINPVQLMELCGYLSKYITTSMNLPLFMLFEDTANFATANSAMQVYKAGMLTRYRTWLQAILEDYWYAPIIADHLGIDIKKVITAPIKIKAIFQDTSFETRTERIASDKLLQDMTVYKPSDSAKDIHEDKIASRLQFDETELDDAIKTQKLQSIDIAKQQADAFTQQAKQKGGGTSFGRKPPKTTE